MPARQFGFSIPVNPIFWRRLGFETVSPFPSRGQRNRSNRGGGVERRHSLAARPRVQPHGVAVRAHYLPQLRPLCRRHASRQAPTGKTPGARGSLQHSVDSRSGSRRRQSALICVPSEKCAELLDAVREVPRGGSPMTKHIARKVTQSFQKAGPSPRPALLQPEGRTPMQP